MHPSIHPFRHAACRFPLRAVAPHKTTSAARVRKRRSAFRSAPAYRTKTLSLFSSVRRARVLLSRAAVTSLRRFALSLRRRTSPRTGLRPRAGWLRLRAGCAHAARGLRLAAPHGRRGSRAAGFRLRRCGAFCPFCAIRGFRGRLLFCCRFGFGFWRNGVRQAWKHIDAPLRARNTASRGRRRWEIRFHTRFRRRERFAHGRCRRRPSAARRKPAGLGSGGACGRMPRCGCGRFFGFVRDFERPRRRLELFLL